MTPFQYFAEGHFAEGLRVLETDAAWSDPRHDLEGPFDLRFPGDQGWGESLLLASLLKRYVSGTGRSTKVFAVPDACSILEKDPAFQATSIEGDEASGARSPLAILRAALVGSLLELPFRPLALGDASSDAPKSAIGFAWASLNRSCEPIPKKSVKFGDVFELAKGAPLNCELVSFQRCDPAETASDTVKGRRVQQIPSKTLQASNQTPVLREIGALRLMISNSTTTAHMAAAAGIPVVLLAKRRKGPQWFWQAQREFRREIYPRVHIVWCDDAGKASGWISEARQLIAVTLAADGTA